MKFSKRILKIFSLIIIFFIGLIAFTGNILAETLADPQDRIEVNAPGPNSRVSGNTSISILAFDDDQATIPASIQLFDAGTCSNNNIGNVGNITSLPSNSTAATNVNWNTSSTNLQSNISDGSYCLKVCVSLKNGTQNYSACNARIVRIINNNSLPVITSVPSNLVIRETDSWQYQVVANDPNGDSLVYRMVFTAPFLTINPTTGLITTNNVSKILPAGITSAEYNLMVEVDDSYSGVVSQQFTLRIVKPAPVVTPPNNNGNNGNNNNNGNNGNNPPPVSTPVTNSPTTINFKNNELLSGGKFSKENPNKTINWEVRDSDGVQSIVLEYSSDQNNWNEIAEFEEEPFPDVFLWDISEIENGKYFLRITVKDSKGVESSKISSEIEIVDKLDEEDIPTEGSVPLIVNAKPENNTDVLTNKPTIYGEFVPSLDSEIDTLTFAIYLDEVNFIEKCNLEKTGFLCQVDIPLDPGIHKVSASVKDTSGKEAKYEWSFNVVDLANQNANQPTVNILGRDIPQNSLMVLILICCIGLVLLGAPWLIYILWSRRNDNYETIESTYTPYAPPPVDVTTTGDTNYTFPDTEITTNYLQPENYQDYSNYPVPPTYAAGTDTIPVQPTPDLNQNIQPVDQPVTPDYTTLNEIPQYTPPDSSQVHTGTTFTEPIDYTTPTDQNTNVDLNQIPPYQPPVEQASAATTNPPTQDYDPNEFMKYIDPNNQYVAPEVPPTDQTGTNTGGTTSDAEFIEPTPTDESKS